MSTVPPIRREILVDADPAAAFEVFTAWPSVAAGGAQRARPLGTATRFATEDDASVAGGFLAVTVRPWQVMMTDRGA